MQKQLIKHLLAASFAGILSLASAAQPLTRAMIDENFAFAAQQYKLLGAQIPADRMPKTFANGKLETSATTWWTSGFFPGSLWLIYEATGDAAIRAEAEKRLKLQESVQRYTGNHDIGFMIYCSFGTAYRLTGNPAFKAIIDTAARWQITRYKPQIQTIQSWNSGERYKCPVIIDNMMNLEQLLWVAQQGGDKQYRDIAIAHANTTLKNHYRPNHSSWHVVDYDLSTGGIIKKVTHQGLADSSAWARGQSWGLYGFTVMYRFTKDKTYLKQAQDIANFLLNHPNLPADKIPYWDYDAQSGNNTLRDASAGSIMASALLELTQYVGKKDKAIYLAAAETMLTSLASEKYRAKAGQNGGFILMHSVGHLPGNSEVDVPLTYADYYFLEALGRYKKWYLK
jgi:rhamnogalacturonyl hydrolase YesR